MALQHEDILWNNPSELPYGKASKLSASVVTASMQIAIERLRHGAPGPIGRASAQLTAKVRASLEGDPDKADIKFNGPATKALNPIANTTWDWYVTPRTTEPITLDLTFYNVDESGDEFDGPAFHTTFTVQSSWKDWILYETTQLHPIYALIVGAFGLIGTALAWGRKRFASDSTGTATTSRRNKPGKR